MKLEDLEVYRLSMELAEMVYADVQTWSYFDKDTVGKQIVRSADSISANISEGFGRFYFKENKLFCYYARGSMFETVTWISKSRNRKLISDEKYHDYQNKFNILGQKLNAYIKSIGKNSNDQ